MNVKIFKYYLKGAVEINTDLRVGNYKLSFTFFPTPFYRTTFYDSKYDPITDQDMFVFGLGPFLAISMDKANGK